MQQGDKGYTTQRKELVLGNRMPVNIRSQDRCLGKMWSLANNDVHI